MLIKINKYAKLTKNQLKEHVEYDGEQGQNKPRWKASMMSMDAIHVHAKKGGEHGKVKANTKLVKILSFVTKKSMIKCPK